MPIGINIEIPQTHCFSEKKDHNWKSRGQHDSSYYQPQPATYNQHQHYHQDRRTQQSCSNNYYDREKVGKHGNIHSVIPITEKKITHFSIGK